MLATYRCAGIKRKRLVEIEDIINTYIGGTGVTGGKQLEILHPPNPHVHLHRVAIAAVSHKIGLEIDKSAFPDMTLRIRNFCMSFNNAVEAY